MTLVEYIKEYWAIILFLSGLCFHAIWNYFRVDNHDKRIGKLEDEREDTVSAIGKINERLSGMDGKLDILVTGYKREK